MDEGGSSVGRCVIRRAYHFCIYQSFQDCLSRFLAIANVQHYSSSAPEPVATPSYSVAPSIAVFPFKTANQAVACFTAKASKTSEKVSFTSKGAS